MVVRRGVLILDQVAGGAGFARRGSRGGAAGEHGMAGAAVVRQALAGASEVLHHAQAAHSSR